VRQDLAHLIEKKKVSEFDTLDTFHAGSWPEEKCFHFKKCVLAARAVLGIKGDRADGGEKRF
jgi:hypothetical protein